MMAGAGVNSAARRYYGANGTKWEVAVRRTLLLGVALAVLCWPLAAVAQPATGNTALTIGFLGRLFIVSLIIVGSAALAVVIYERVKRRRSGH
jgi:hypothetical protein